MEVRLAGNLPASFILATSPARARRILCSKLRPKCEGSLINTLTKKPSVRNAHAHSHKHGYGMAKAGYWMAYVYG